MKIEKKIGKYLNESATLPFDYTSDVSLTSYLGQISTTFDKLKRTFGYPNLGATPDKKTQVCWGLLIDGVAICTIYDYKQTAAPEEITSWSVGCRKKGSSIVKMFLNSNGFLLKG